MNILAVKQNLKTGADLPLEHLASNKAMTEKQKLDEACRQFEAVFLRQILQEAQRPVFKSSVFDNSATSEIYRDLATFHLADSISKSGQLGLAVQLQQELGRRVEGKDNLQTTN